MEIIRGYDLKAWREDEKLIVRQAAGIGQEAKPTLFLVTDTQIINEQFLEDINNILNAGEVPNLRPRARSRGLPRVPRSGVRIGDSLGVSRVG